jgi:hypothetical protein
MVSVSEFRSIPGRQILQKWVRLLYYFVISEMPVSAGAAASTASFTVHMTKRRSGLSAGTR